MLPPHRPVAATRPARAHTAHNIPQIYEEIPRNETKGPDLLRNRRAVAPRRGDFPAFFLESAENFLLLPAHEGGLAQLARALAWHARGHQFDPGILHNPGKDGHKSILIFLSESVPCIHKYPPLSSCSDRAQTGRGTIRIRTKPRAGSARAKKTAIGRKKNAITSNTGQ